MSDTGYVSPFAESSVEKSAEELPEKSEQEQLADDIQSILAEFDLMESNIPVSHEYWSKCNKLRALLRK